MSRKHGRPAVPKGLEEYSLGYAFEVKLGWRDLWRVIRGARLRFDLRLFTKQKPESKVRAQASGAVVIYVNVPQGKNGVDGMAPEPIFSRLAKSTELKAWHVPSPDGNTLLATLAARETEERKPEGQAHA